ncbi:MAG TPA: protein phosphatase 2C domain-containing protein [Planctomycetota bacterium]|jgi:hypothetical protein
MCANAEENPATLSPPRTTHFQVACGTVLGREHALAGRNSQDAYCCKQNENGLVAVVCDGCSSGKHNEVGAKLGARILAEALHRCLPKLDRAHSAELLESVRRYVLRRFETLTRTLGPGRVANVETYFLFTALGALIGPSRSLIFALGDGIIFLNGRQLALPVYDNRPPYLCYGLIENALSGISAADLRFRVLAELPSAQIATLAIGSDGAAKLAGEIPKLCDDDRIFTNPQTLTRRLSQLNREVRNIDWEARRVDRRPGLFSDDATLVLVRNRSAPARRPAPLPPPEGGLS